MKEQELAGKKNLKSLYYTNEVNMAEKDIVNAEMNEIRNKTNELLELEADSKNLLEIKKKLFEILSLINKLAHSDEKEFIINELKKKGYPLENYVQWCLAEKGWHIQANTYFYDKDGKTGRELDIKAWKPAIVSTFTDFSLNLYIQCKKLLGNVWIFFSSPQDESIFSGIQRVMFADYFDDDHYLSDDIFKEKGTHFDKCDVIATNHCELIVDKEKSNKRDDNIWESEITLIKAISQQVERENEFLKQRLEELSSYSRFSIKHYEKVEVFYPIIVFEGNMYEAKFISNDIVLSPKDYIRLQFDYYSGNYNGKYFIDVVSKAKFASYLNEVTYDLEIFDTRRKELSKGYEKGLLRDAKKYYLRKKSSR